MLESPPPRREIEPDPLPLALRAATLGIIAAILLGVLVTRLWALQILHADQYVQAATQQTVRYTTLPAERGMIVDANGVAMVKSSGTLGVQLNPGTLPQPINCDGITKNHREKLKDEPGCAVMFRLADVLQIPFNGPEGIVSQYWYGQRQNHGHPVAIKATVTKSEVEYVTERMNQYRGVEFFSTYQRQYEKAANWLRKHPGPCRADHERVAEEPVQRSRSTCRARAPSARTGSSSPTIGSCAAPTARWHRCSTPAATRRGAPTCRRRHSRATR